MTDEMKSFVKQFLNSSFAKEYVTKVFVSDIDTETLYYSARKPYQAFQARNAVIDNKNGFCISEVAECMSAEDVLTHRVLSTLKEVKMEEL